MTQNQSTSQLGVLALVTVLAPMLAVALACQGNDERASPPPISQHPSQDPGSGAPDSTREVGPEALEPAPQAPIEEAAEARMLSVAELRHIMEVLEEPVLLVDVRSRKDFEQRHAEGAVSLPLRELSARAVEELPQDVLLVTYCT
jgi:hypothetical protein